MNLLLALLAIPHLRRAELRDHAFGDCEVTIYNDFNKTISNGYFGGSSSYITIMGFDFRGDVARDVRNAIKLSNVERNDSTGPDEFEVGVIMPALTLQGVREELFG